MHGVKVNGFTTLEALEAYYDGVAAGLVTYAWMRDGTMYVGTTGSTLAEVQHELDGTRAVAVAKWKAEQVAIAEALAEGAPVAVEPLVEKKGKKK